MINMVWEFFVIVSSTHITHDYEIGYGKNM